MNMFLDKKDPNRKNGRNLNLITCEECGLICAGQSHYNVHIRSHTGKLTRCALIEFIHLVRNEKKEKSKTSIYILYNIFLF